MLRASLSRLTLVAGVALGLAACQEDQSPTAVIPSRPSASAQASQGAGPPTADELDRQVPGFGGFFLDATGAPTIYLTRGSSRAAAERALGGYLAARGFSNSSLRVLEGRYGWQQLQRWQDAATEDAFQFAGTVFVDNDETSNRVRIGVENPNAAGQIRAALARSGMPDDAVIIERADPIVQVSTLQGADRPVRAGVQINFGLYVCSVGFNAMWNGVNGVPSFVTASHCTNKQGGVEGTKYGQPLLSNGTIATEVADPSYTKLKGCPGNKVCRYSDASRAAYADPANQALGKIAKTSGTNGSLDITDTFTITSDDCTGKDGGCLAVGAVVNKVGRTTGWTQGVITNTCTNTGVQGTRIVQLCQTFVSAGVGGGDSGSDVFVITGGTDVMLAGVLWGGNNSGTQFVFSPFSNVVKELGALTTH